MLAKKFSLAEAFSADRKMLVRDSQMQRRLFSNYLKNWRGGCGVSDRNFSPDHHMSKSLQRYSFDHFNITTSTISNDAKSIFDKFTMSKTILPKISTEAKPICTEAFSSVASHEHRWLFAWYIKDIPTLGYILKCHEISQHIITLLILLYMYCNMGIGIIFTNFTPFDSTLHVLS